MARILVAPETFNLGETSRGIEVARALRTVGHEILITGYSRRFARYVERAGFELRLLEPELSDAEADQMIAADQGRSVRHPFTEQMLGRRVASELAVMDAWRPDAVVIGSTMSMLISARAAGVPLVYVKPFAMSRTHLATITEIPMVAPNGPLAPVASGLNRLAGSAARWVAPRIRWTPASFRAVAARHGVRLPDRTLDVLSGDINLIASLFPAVDGRHMHDGEIAVGPVYAKNDGELPEAVVRLAERDRPLVYVGMGSSAGRTLALSVLRQVAGMDVDVLTTTGRYLTAADRASLPANVHVYDFLPAHRLAGLIDASVIHGGEGTVQTACASGVPFAGIGLQLEQRWNLEECARFGNALRFTTAQVRRGRVSRLVACLLHDTMMAHAARRLAEIAEEFDGPAACVGLIEDAIERPQRMPTPR